MLDDAMATRLHRSVFVCILLLWPTLRTHLLGEATPKDLMIVSVIG